jgi:hypothetical protein
VIQAGILQPIDYVGRVQQGFALGQQQRKEAEMDKALQALAANPQDPQALQSVIRYNPQLGMQIRNQQAAAQEKRAAELAKVFGHAARAAKTPQQWDAIAGYLAQNGVPGAQNVVGKFSPEMRLAYMAQAGLEDDAQDPTSLQRNYEFIKQLNPELAEQYIRGQAEGSPIVQHNADGTMTLYPRSVIAQGQPSAPQSGSRQITSKAEYDALPPGTEYIDPTGKRRVKGGQPGQPSAGGFPASGN